MYGWLKKYREGGQGALLAKPVPGRPPRLALLQMRRLWTLIAGTDPRQLQFDFALWTTEMVHELIRREFGVGLSAVSVGRLLGQDGAFPAAAAMARLPAESGGGGAVETGGIPGHRRGGRRRRHHLDDEPIGI